MKKLADALIDFVDQTVSVTYMVGGSFDGILVAVGDGYIKVKSHPDSKPEVIPFHNIARVR